ncbi:MAG: preprotein translocase subunit YajC [Treponema sp.]|nr:preprotein translocase subunit YajC [Treponema sp.]
MLLMIGAFIAIFYFLLIRPQSKKRKETEKMLSALKKGDRIVTIGGIYGTIHNVRDTTVIVKVDDSTKLEFLRSAISTVTVAAPDKEDKTEEKNETEESKNEE